MSEGYNGWKTYETWLVNVCDFFSDDPGLFDFVKDCKEDGKDKRESIYELSGWLEERVNEAAPELDNGLFSDLLNSAISEVNFYELAEHYLEDPWNEISEEEEEEEEGGAQ